MSRELWRTVEAQKLAAEAQMLATCIAQADSLGRVAGGGQDVRRDRIVRGLALGWSSGRNPGPTLIALQVYAQVIADGIEENP